MEEIPNGYPIPQAAGEGMGLSGARRRRCLLLSPYSIPSGEPACGPRVPAWPRAVPRVVGTGPPTLPPGLRAATVRVLHAVDLWPASSWWLGPDSAGRGRTLWPSADLEVVYAGYGYCDQALVDWYGRWWLVFAVQSIICSAKSGQSAPLSWMFCGHACFDDTFCKDGWNGRWTDEQSFWIPRTLSKLNSLGVSVCHNLTVSELFD